MIHIIVTETRLCKAQINLYKKASGMEWTEHFSEQVSENTYIRSIEKDIVCLNRRDSDTFLEKWRLCAVVGLAQHTSTNEDYVLVLVPDTVKRICKHFLLTRSSLETYLQSANERNMFGCSTVKFNTPKGIRMISVKLMEFVHFISDANGEDQGLVHKEWDQKIMGSVENFEVSNVQ